jgi:hypothetical protein
MKANTIQKVELIDVVSGTTTNEDGYALFLSLDKYLVSNCRVELSLKGMTPMSSSFLNSSFGELVEKHGMAKLKESLFFCNYKMHDVSRIKSYVASLHSMSC